MVERRIPINFLESLLRGRQPAASSEALARFLAPTKRKIFVSYYHGGDQAYYDIFSQRFSDEWGVVTDNSLERAIDSDDTDYVMRRIRENYVSGTSCTIVLCGRDTPERKYVDWEIKATLDDRHGLVGVGLPDARRTAEGTVIVPDRFVDNWTSNYAVWVHWDALFADSNRLRALVNDAVARPADRIANSRAMRSRNG
jgi:hypothetical protein